jgi:hypothetical protein
MIVGFFVRHFLERGTEVAIYDYANYNEEILGNKSYIICFNPDAQRRIKFPVERPSYERFRARFTVVEIDSIEDMQKVIRDLNLDFFYTLTYGGGGDIYRFDSKEIWQGCKTIKHCVFETTCPEADFYVCISDMLNINCRTSVPVIPHIVSLPEDDQNLRANLGIPENSIVFGRHGGFDQFNIRAVHDAIEEYLKTDDTCYFLFLNTRKFIDHPRVIHLELNTDPLFKTRFINTCDVMIHARDIGETFGLAVAEFSSKNKPVITCPIGDIEHLRILGDKAIIYRSIHELKDIFGNIRVLIKTKSDWNAYRSYSPEIVMNMFKAMIFDKSIGS